LGHLVPVAEKELSGDGHFVCGGSDRGGHWIFLGLDFSLGVVRFGEINLTQTIAEVNIFFQ